MFLNDPNKFTFSNPRRVSFHTKYESEFVNDSAESMSLTRSVLYVDFRSAELPSGAVFAARLLRVLDLDMRTDLDMRMHRFPTEILELVNLRFLRFNLHYSGDKYILSIPKGISRLWNLQTLIAPLYMINEPAELWKLSELRNLELFSIWLLKDEEMNYSVLKKLEKISSRIGWFPQKAFQTSWDGFLKSIPNIKKLSIHDRAQTTSTAIDLSHLHKLENLRYNYTRSTSSPDGFGCCFRVIFPHNIRKLVLLHCEMYLGAWRTLCALHKLEVLTMFECSFKSEGETCDEEWELADGDVFPSLQFLTLHHLTSLVRWIADETNFPILRHLCLFSCENLEEIPSGIGEISTLQLIDLANCTKSTVDSAKRIVEEQSENGNDDLKLWISGTSESGGGGGGEKEEEED